MQACGSEILDARDFPGIEVGTLAPHVNGRVEITLLLQLVAELEERVSQDLPELFGPTGAVWWARTDALRRAGTFHLAGRTGWEIDWTHAIDIDTEDDWRLADALMGRP